MAVGASHFEIFARKGPGAAWIFEGSYSTRDRAVDAAEKILAGGQVRAVRVYHESFNDNTGELVSLKVFEQGDAAGRVVKDSVRLPCAKPDDFYTTNAKRTIARLLRDALANWRITATELLHHPGHVQRLELAGTVLQQAIQKWAVKHAGVTGQPVQQIIIKLNELVTETARRVVLDGRGHKFPSIEKEGFAPLLARLVNGTTPDYILNGALARHIAHARTWAEKLDCLLVLMSKLPEDEAARALGVNAIDTIITEMFAGSAAVLDLLGEQPDLGTALLHLTNLFLGRSAEMNGFPECLDTLACAFAQGQLSHARAAIGERILREIRGARRLKSTSLDDEIVAMCKLAAALTAAQGTLFSPDDFEDAFTARSSHLVVSETVERYLAGVERPGEKIEKVLGLARNVVGSTNKRELVFFLNGILGSSRTETFYVDGREPVQARLAELRRLQVQVQSAALHETHRKRLAEALDLLAVAVERKAGFLDGLAKSNPAPAVLAEQLLLLLAGQGVTEGTLADKARARIRECLGNPHLASSLSEFDERRAGRFPRLLTAAGIEASLPRKAAS